MSKEKYKELLKMVIECENSNICTDCIEEVQEALKKEDENYEDVEIEVSEETLATLALMAHEQGITLNDLCVNVLKDRIKEDSNEENKIKTFGFDEAVAALRDGKRVYVKESCFGEQNIYCKLITNIIQLDDDEIIINDDKDTDYYEFYIEEDMS